MVNANQLDEVCLSVSSLYFSTGFMLRTLCPIWKVDPAVALDESACKLCFGCLGPGCIVSPFFLLKSSYLFDHVLGLVCHLGVAPTVSHKNDFLTRAWLIQPVLRGFCRGALLELNSKFTCPAQVIRKSASSLLTFEILDLLLQFLRHSSLFGSWHPIKL